MIKKDTFQQDNNTFWKKAFFANQKREPPLLHTRPNVTKQHQEKIGDAGALWLKLLFQGKITAQNNDDKLRIYKLGVVVYEIPLPFLEQKTVIGRHPNADLQLESPKLALYHAAILNNNEKFYIESLDNNNGILIKNKKLKLKTPVQIHDGMQIDIPGYRLEFSIANTTGAIDDDAFEANELNDIPDFSIKHHPIHY